MADSAAEARIDQALVVRARLGNDPRAFEQLVRRHQGLVRAQLRRLLHGDHAAADDLAQEAFLLAWRKLDQFRSEARFSTWLYRIAYSCFLQACRKNRGHLATMTKTKRNGCRHRCVRSICRWIWSARCNACPSPSRVCCCIAYNWA